MSLRQPCEFFLLRYVPDAVKNEFVNIGVVLLTREDGLAKVRFTRDWSRVRCLDPQADVELLGALETEISDRLRDGIEGPEKIIARLQDSLSNMLQISSSKALLAESPDAEIERLAQYYLERPRQRPLQRPLRRREGRSGIRQRLLAQMQDAFEVAGVWQALHKRIPAATYTRPGDPLRIDCGYQPNGVVRLFHALALSTEPESAKVLAFTYPLLTEGIARVRKATTDLTAIIEDELDRADNSIQFALEILERTSIQVAPLSQMPAIAERARVELRM